MEICTQYAQQGMLTMFLGVFFSTLAFAFVEPFFFIGYLISIAMFGLYQAFFMANAGGAWDNAKKIVEIDLHAKGTALHEATIIGDTVGDPYKDTSSVALNPVIKFTTLFGLLAVELSVSLTTTACTPWCSWLAAVFFLASAFFVYRSFYGMRIQSTLSDERRRRSSRRGRRRHARRRDVRRRDDLRRPTGPRRREGGRPMKIAVRYPDVLVDADGHVAGHDAGATLVRRLLRIFPGSILVGDGPRRCAGFDLPPLEFVDPADTVVINMAAARLGRGLAHPGAAPGGEPHVMNFVWWSTSQFHHPVERAASPCRAPCSRRSPTRSARRARSARSSSAGRPGARGEGRGRLGQPRHPARPRAPAARPRGPRRALPRDLPVRPQAAAAVPGRRRAGGPAHARCGSRPGCTSRTWPPSRRCGSRCTTGPGSGPLTATREDYWAALARTTAFLATATDESYGLEYIEALVAGAVGVLPDRPWARAILPAGYPFLYRTPAEAEEMLLRAVTDTDACRREADASAGGSFAEWLRARHDDDRFDAAIVEQVGRWFGA